MYVAYSRELDVSSCGGTAKRTTGNLREAVRRFLEQAARMGTLEQVLEEAGYRRKGKGLEPPRLIGFSDQRLTFAGRKRAS